MKTLKRSGCWALSLIASGLLVGCAFTVTPRLVEPTSPSLDEYGQPTSGVITVTTNGDFLVTAGWVDRYSAMVKTWGAKIDPPWTSTNGVVRAKDGTNYLVSPSAYAAECEMLLHARQHKTP